MLGEDTLVANRLSVQVSFRCVLVAVQMPSVHDRRREPVQVHLES